MTLTMSYHSGDPVRPSNEAFDAAFANGYQTWSYLHNLVGERGQDETILETLRSIDNAIPLYPRLPANLATSSPIRGIALAKGTVTWEVSQQEGDGQPLKHDMRLQVASSSPVQVQCLLDDAGELQAPGLRPRDNRQVTMLFAAWAYVFSARWAELLPASAVMRYTACENSGPAHAEDSLEHEALSGLGDVDDNARQWWQRVLTAGLGWEARFTMDGQGEMHSPWSISLDRKRGQKRRRANTRANNATAGRAASFGEAMAYLQDFTNHHRAYDQSRAAFAAALFIPVARHDHRDVHLCSPCFQEGAFQNHEALDTEPANFTPTSDLVDRLLLLGCNTFGMKALLCSTFYEPGVFCNLSGPWIQGLIKPMSDCDPATRLSILIRRDPDIGFLWMGAYLTGTLETCLKQISRGLWKVDLNVGGLTGTSMSFAQDDIAIDASVSSISRADECKVQYMYQHNLDAPNFVFPPFGSTTLANLDLEVRLRLQDSPLSMQLRNVTWETTMPPRTTTLLATPRRKKTGPTSQLTVEVPPLSAEEHTAAVECSKTITRDAFGWLREAPVLGNRANASETSVMVEGGVMWTPEERGIFEHEWLRSFFSIAPADEETEG